MTEPQDVLAEPRTVAGKKHVFLAGGNPERRAIVLRAVLDIEAEAVSGTFDMEQLAEQLHDASHGETEHKYVDCFHADHWRGKADRLSRRLDASRAALVRTPETLDVQRLAMALDRGRHPLDALTLGVRRTAERVAAEYAASPAPTPPEGLRQKLIVWFADLNAGMRSLSSGRFAAGNPEGNADAILALLAASPAPDPGAGLREAAQEVIAADGAVARQEAGADRRWDEALAALDAGVREGLADVAAGRVKPWSEVRARLAPSAEPPETET